MKTYKEKFHEDQTNVEDDVEGWNDRQYRRQQMNQEEKEEWPHNDPLLRSGHCENWEVWFQWEGICNRQIGYNNIDHNPTSNDNLANSYSNNNETNYNITNNFNNNESSAKRRIRKSLRNVSSVKRVSLGGEVIESVSPFQKTNDS